MEFQLTDEITKRAAKFTKSQQKAINDLLDFIAKPFNPADYIHGLVGKGGTGKTYIINYIIQNCIYSPSVITCTSPTHKACRIFSQAIGDKAVETIQSTFGFRLNTSIENFDPNNPNFQPMGRTKLDVTKLLIIDESSMLPIKLVNYIVKICKEKEIKVIMLGDDYQLAPVNEYKSTAFTRCTYINELTEIVRQGETNPIIELLDMLRYDISNKTYNFISYIYSHIGINKRNEIGEGYTIVDRDNFVKLLNISFTDEEYTKNIDMYRIVAYTNLAIKKWNNYIRYNIIKDAESNIITKNDLLMSYSTILDEFGGIILNNSEEYIVKDIIDYVDPTYNFKGFYIKFQQVHGGMVTRPIFIIDHRDENTIKTYYKILTDFLLNAKTCVNKSERIGKWKAYYDFKNKYLTITNIIDTKNNTKLMRDIDYGFAITSYKSQGSTYDNVFVDLYDMIYDYKGKPYTNQQELLRRLYVACSRAKKSLILCCN